MLQSHFALEMIFIDPLKIVYKRSEATAACACVAVKQLCLD